MYRTSGSCTQGRISSCSGTVVDRQGEDQPAFIDTTKLSTAFPVAPVEEKPHQRTLSGGSGTHDEAERVEMQTTAKDMSTPLTPVVAKPRRRRRKRSNRSGTHSEAERAEMPSPTKAVDMQILDGSDSTDADELPRTPESLSPTRSNLEEGADHELGGCKSPTSPGRVIPRPCKGKRDRWKKVIRTLELRILANPESFAIDEVFFPGCLMKEELFAERMRGRLVTLHEEALQQRSNEGERAAPSDLTSLVP